MPQEKPAWMEYARELKIMRADTRGKHNNEFASKNMLDELFDNADGPDKAGMGVLTFIEIKKALMDELNDRTRLKNSDNLVQETVIEALRRAFNATKNMVAQGGDPNTLDREEMRIMLVYLERFFQLLDMFNVIELDKGKPATFKQGGNEMPVCVREKDFALAIPVVRSWGVTIEGRAPDIFAELNKGLGKMGFDEFAHWALKTSLGFGEAAIGNTAVSFAAILTPEQQARYDGLQYKSVQQKEAEEAKALLEAGISGAKAQMAKNAADKQAAMDLLKVLKPGDRGYPTVAARGAPPSSLAGRQ
ncbi:flagellar calcium-binding protein [Chrysochromulina tobinii]|uniref:Flagellar calcium-binding protein n=1 Tax=Chrysochromulina tobinii TaxID=1460289 RepID=A0A0M0K9Z7_9EUKA|nr:flagellar calcium-binding protein [Chrysochromulina tobinii]|eukprot:KOO35645.1 flagellar calcium-binding protein [Chrysochromulina sp. CCMP291]